jgi:SAM-dependent methyltransferase
MPQLSLLYKDRKLSTGFPDMERRGAEFQAHSQDSGQPSGHLYIHAFMDCMKRLIDVDGKVLLLGCGPRPYALRWLRENGYDAEGIEPVEISVKTAKEFGPVHLGSAEMIPFRDESCKAVFMESVLEHVDSPEKSLAECYRVLEPGGALFVYTTNRWKINLRGFNGEYQVPFFNWFPRIVQESYVFQAIHYRPELANYNARPAFHWFTYPDLCRLGRGAGFGQFYSTLDLADVNNKLIARSKFRRFFLNKVRYNPWLRSLALTQAGGAIFMLKRS